MKCIRIFFDCDTMNGDDLEIFLKDNKVKYDNLILARDKDTKIYKGYGFIKMTNEDFIDFNPPGHVRRNNEFPDWFITKN